MIPEKCELFFSSSDLWYMQAGAYYMGMLAYYWVLATPAVGFLFGCYLYIAVNWFHVHYDEAFSALRIPNFKGFSRLHINTDGDLEIYGLAMDKVGRARQLLIFWSSMFDHASTASHRAF